MVALSERMNVFLDDNDLEDTPIYQWADEVKEVETQVDKYKQVLNRFVEVAGYLENTERIAFSKDEVTAMMMHVLKGGGYL